MINLEPNEVIHNKVRRHWYKFATESVSMLSLVVLPCLIYPILIATGWVDFNLADFSLFLFIMSSVAAAIWLVFSIVYTNYFLDVWIITNLRIVDIEQHGLFVREISEYRIDRIQDVTIKVGGILGTFLNFGDVEIQTAGESSDKFVIKNAAFPQKVKDDILKLQNQVLATAHAPSGIQSPNSMANGNVIATHANPNSAESAPAMPPATPSNQAIPSAPPSVSPGVPEMQNQAVYPASSPSSPQAESENTAMPNQNSTPNTTL